MYTEQEERELKGRAGRAQPAGLRASWLTLNTETSSPARCCLCIDSLLPRTSLIAPLVKNLSAMRETWVQSLDWEDPLDKGKVTHASFLVWRIPWTIRGHKELEKTEQLSHHHFHIIDELTGLAKEQSLAVIQTQAAWLPHPHAPALLLKIQALGGEGW